MARTPQLTPDDHFPKQALQESVQAFPKELEGTSYTFTWNIASAADLITPWGRSVAVRDRQIRDFWHSPLAISATEIFKRNADCFDGETRDILLNGGDPLDLPEIIYSRTTEESQAINEDSRPGIIISASGMCESGRIQHHLKHHLWRPGSHVVIIGYQAQGTVGRRLVDGARTIRLGEDIAVKAHIHTLGGFSSHADQKGLIEWISHFKNPRLEVFVNHGEEKVSTVLAQAIRRRFPFNVSIPQWREKRTLFEPEEQVSAERVIPEREGEEEVPQVEEKVSNLMKELNRTTRELTRRLKKEKSRGKPFHDSKWLKRLAEVSAELDELNSELADMFELGVKVQVLRAGTLFGVRAQRLHDLYVSHDSLEALAPEARERLEREVLGLPLEAVWDETRRFWLERDPREVQRAEHDGKHRMALVFRWYLGKSSRWAIAGDANRRMDYQIWCGPAMGAFNAWVAGSFLVDPEARSAVQMARNLLEGAAVVTRAQQLRTYGVPVPPSGFQFRPRPLA